MRQTILNLNVWYLLIFMAATFAVVSGQTGKMNQLNLQKWTMVKIESGMTEDTTPKDESLKCRKNEIR